MTNDSIRPLEAQLRDYFEKEVALAESDAGGRTRQMAAHGRRPLVVLLTIVAAVSVAALMIRITDAARAPLPNVGSEPNVVYGRDGIPSSIASEPVLRGVDILTVVSTMQDDQPFLVGGWLIYAYADCAPSSASTDLMDPCGSGPYLSDTAPSPHGAPPDLDTALRVVVARLEIPPDGATPVVLRVHVYDDAATLCPVDRRQECHQTLVADAVVWP